VLEHSVTEELARVPEGPPADELRRRARVRRARRMGSVGSVAMVFTVIVLGTMLQSPASHRVQVTEPASTTPDQPASTTTTIVIPDSPLPLATTAEFPQLQKMLGTVSGMVTSDKDPKAVAQNPTSAQIVATTDTKAWALWGGTRNDTPIYVVQVTGKFVCNGCSRPATATESPHGDAIQVFFDHSGNGAGFGMSREAKDLSSLGRVYRLPLPGLP
jgi:hypothetical protein